MSEKPSHSLTAPAPQPAASPATPAAAVPRLRRRFIDVNGRAVHYLRIGSGPPVVLVHSSPTNAWYVEPQMRLLAARHTCFAFDTPGFGLSQALPGDTLSVAQLAAALADNMAAVGLPPCPVFGTHTGAAIALALGAQHPERVTALMLDAVPIFTAQEFDQLFSGYFEPLVPDDRGGHYARTWTRFRDQYAWFPWTQKTPDRHNETDLGSAAALHAWVMSFFYAGRTYKPAYRAALADGADALAHAAALRVPAVYTANESDMLYPHLDRLPPLQQSQQIRLIGNDRSAKDALIEEVFTRWPAQAKAPSDQTALAQGAGLRMQFVDLPGGTPTEDHAEPLGGPSATPRGQVLLRHAGLADRPALLLLHDAPGSSRMLERLIDELSADHLVLAPDLPGCGGSDPLSDPAAGDDARPELSAFADAVAQTCDRLGIERACVYGIGIGASVALALAERHPRLACAVMLRGVALPDAAERADLLAHDAPRITPQPDGSHWYRTWLMLRDRRIWFPWYDTRAARLRRVPADLSADDLHDATFDLMKQHAAYHQVIEATWRHDAEAGLRGLRQPLALCHDPRVPLFAHDERLRRLCPQAIDLPCESAAHARAVARFTGAHQRIGLGRMRA